MLNLNDLALFVRVAETGGFSAAARATGLPKATLSKRFAALEAELGARLAQRSSHSFALTEAGRDFLHHARAAVIEAETAEEAVRRRLAAPSGTVRLTAAVPTAQFWLAPHLPALAEALPEVRLVLHATDRFVDLVQEGFDIAVRSHFAPLPDSALVQRRVAEDPLILAAAPAYLAARGDPEEPEALAGHDGLMPDLTGGPWQMHGPDGREATARPTVRMAADESLVLLGAAEAGLGITRLPLSICRAALEAGRLRRVLPGWTAGRVATTLLMPHRRGQLPAVRAVADFLAARLGAEDTAAAGQA